MAGEMPRGDELVASRDIGVAFTIVCDLGFAVGLCTHKHSQMGHLVWMAEPTFEQFPTVADVCDVHAWRWPVFFPLGAALRRKVVDRIGRVPVPTELMRFPVMRNGGHGQPWMEVRDGHVLGLGPRTENRDLPIVTVVNDTRLKEMLVSGWRPAERW